MNSDYQTLWASLPHWGENNAGNSRLGSFVLNNPALRTFVNNEPTSVKKN